MIELKKVNKIYNNKVHALKDINLKVEKGDIYGIIGYSGAGKSTLVRLLNGLEVATDGEVIIDGDDFNKITEEQRRLKRQRIGMIFQHFNLLWSRTVAENIAFPLEILGKSKTEIKERVEELAKLVGLEDRLNAYPSQLSGGQKQRVGIARALAGNPSILLCDEATSALDPETTAEVLNLIKEIHNKTNITVVLITHEMNVIKTICTKVAVIDGGTIAENGLVSEVFYHPTQEVTKKFLAQSISIFRRCQLQWRKNAVQWLSLERSTAILSVWLRFRISASSCVVVLMYPTQDRSVFLRLLANLVLLQAYVVSKQLPAVRHISMCQKRMR